MLSLNLRKCGTCLLHFLVWFALANETQRASFDFKVMVDAVNAIGDQDIVGKQASVIIPRPMKYSKVLMISLLIRAFLVEMRALRLIMDI